MSEPLCRLANEARCLCSNDSPLRFRRFHDREADELLGLQCLTCEKEYLKETFVKYLNLARHILKPGRYRLYFAEKVHLPEDSAHMVPLSIDEINVKFFHNCLKPGDHVAWKRPRGYLHHAIITEMNNGNKIRVVHWHSNIGKNPGPGCKIQEQWIVLEEEWGILYRVNYSEEIVKANPSRLVIARARSRIGEKGYHPITDNCETFASFCKYGVRNSCLLEEGQPLGN